jgi:hypothetical protein
MTMQHIFGKGLYFCTCISIMYNFYCHLYLYYSIGYVDYKAVNIKGIIENYVCKQA